jgi:hypothetical protein
VLPERLPGFEGAVYHDRLTDPRPQRHGAQPIRLTGETDRIYLPPSAATTIDDLRHGRRISIRQDGSGVTVVWNPWIDKARAMADFGEEEWTGMVCLEPCIVDDSAIRLDPGAARHDGHSRGAGIGLRSVTCSSGADEGGTPAIVRLPFPRKGDVNNQLSWRSAE